MTETNADQFANSLVMSGLTTENPQVATDRALPLKRNVMAQSIRMPQAQPRQGGLRLAAWKMKTDMPCLVLWLPILKRMLASA